MQIRDNRTRAERERDRLWGWVRIAALAVVLVLVALVLLGADDVPEEPDAQARRARFVAQERYYRVLDTYGDVVGATQAAELVYRDLMEEVEGQ